MAKAIQNETKIKTLINKIKIEIETGRQRVRQTFENERTKTYWKIGKYIHKHLLNYSERANYGEYLFKRLTEELDIGIRTLYRTVQFYETYTSIVSVARTQLTWGHFKILITVENEEKRNEYEQKILNENISTAELEDLVRNEKEPDKTDKIQKIKQKRGMPYIYRLKAVGIDKKEPEILIDLGFRIYIKKPGNKMSNYDTDNILKVNKKNNRYTFKSMNDIEDNKLYTYKAYIKEIIDGDTIWMNIDLGFETWTCQKVRLRKINTGGIETKQGKQARNYIAKILKNCEYVVIKTYWRDKYNRYLADIFYDETEKDVNKLAEKGRYLNQELLDKGLAEKYYM